MSKFCCAPGCKTGSKSTTTQKKLSLFKPPEDQARRDTWERLIPRKDFKLTKGKRVCELHFDERFIERNYVHVINGEKTEFPRGHPKLCKDAIPTIFPNLPKYLSKTLPKQRTSPSSRLKAASVTQNNDQTSSKTEALPIKCYVAPNKEKDTSDSAQTLNPEKTTEKRVIEPIVTISIERANKFVDETIVEYRTNEEWSALLDQRIMEICVLKMSVRNLDKKVNRLKDKLKVQKTLIQKLQRKKCTNCFNAL